MSIAHAPDTFVGDTFVSRFDKSKGEPLVYGGAIGAVFMGLMALKLGQPLLVALVLAAAAISLFHLPTIRLSRPQIVIGARGLSIDGLGFVPWSAVRSARLVERWVRTIRVSEIVFTLDGAVCECVERDATVSLARQLMIRVWRARGNEIAVKTDGLEDRPETILGAVNRYLDPRRAQDAGTA